MIWEVGGEIRRLPASIETPACWCAFNKWFLINSFFYGTPTWTPRHCPLNL